MKLTLGFSPCPNDTFIFDAMVHNRIDTEGLSFEVIMEDVEALNHRAFQKDLQVTKLSCNSFLEASSRKFKEIATPLSRRLPSPPPGPQNNNWICISSE